MEMRMVRAMRLAVMMVGSERARLREMMVVGEGVGCEMKRAANASRAQGSAIAESLVAGEVGSLALELQGRVIHRARIASTRTGGARRAASDRPR